MTNQIDVAALADKTRTYVQKLVSEAAPTPEFHEHIVSAILRAALSPEIATARRRGGLAKNERNRIARIQLVLRAQDLAPARGWPSATYAARMLARDPQGSKIIRAARLSRSRATKTITEWLSAAWRTGIEELLDAEAALYEAHLATITDRLAVGDLTGKPRR